jgi:hypothetical protein
MSLLTNQTSINPTTDFFAPNSSIIPITLQSSAEPIQFSPNDIVRIANVPIPSSLTSNDNYIFNCGISLSGFTNEGGLAGNVAISVSYPDSSVVLGYTFYVYDTISTFGITIPPFIANIGSNTEINIDMINQANVSFDALYGFFNPFFLKLSSGGIQN